MRSGVLWCLEIGWNTNSSVWYMILSCHHSPQKLRRKRRNKIVKIYAYFKIRYPNCSHGYDFPCYHDLMNEFQNVTNLMIFARLRAVPLFFAKREWAEVEREARASGRWAERKWVTNALRARYQKDRGTARSLDFRMGSKGSRKLNPRTLIHRKEIF